MQIEALEEVERAFVHVDYASRELPEHKVSSPMPYGLHDCLRTFLRLCLSCKLYTQRHSARALQADTV